MNENKTINFDDYPYADREGVYEGVLAGRWSGRGENVFCFFDMQDGRKLRASVWQDRQYLGLKEMPIGSKLRLQFKRAASGRVYLKQAENLSYADEPLPWD